MTTVTVAEAQAKLADLIAGLPLGGRLVIEQDGRPIATLTRTSMGGPQQPRKAGSGKTAEFWMAPDFNAPLDEFREYTE
jgi:antitoxin (DNA-binding transcriptional repressor) of toxin-antitoxin stability system